MSTASVLAPARHSAALPLVSRLLERLDEEGIGYCHWKSNWALDASLAGATDVDLLVDRRHAATFRLALQELGFRPSVELGVAPFPSVEHFHALDLRTLQIVHAHAYYRVITGDSLTKSYRLPIESMLLGTTRRLGLVVVPTRGAELVVFVLRMSLKHTSALELGLLARDWDKLRDEATWLAGDDAQREAVTLVARWLPGVDEDVFGEALEALVSPASLRRRIRASRRLRRQLRAYRRRGRLHSSLIAARACSRAALGRLRRSRSRLAPTSGGAVIAFVGAEATGKSSLLDEIERWLGAHFSVRRIHAGKPPSTVLTAAPNLFLPALRMLTPARRSTAVGADLARERHAPGAFPLLFGVRSAMLAHDRRALLRRAHARSANGEIVLCDRYPSDEPGAVDGRQLGRASSIGVRKQLARLESRLYDGIVPPDLVIRLTAPLSVTLERNRAREKREPDEYVVSRHARARRVTFERATVVSIDTDRPFDEVARQVKRAIWEAL